jgi:hypothetical protein
LIKPPNKLTNTSKLFDDSSSMRPSWLGSDGVVKTFEALGYLVKGCTPYKMRAVLAASNQFLENKHRTPIIKKLGNPNLDEQCNMSYWLRNILNKWIAKKGLSEKSERTGLNLYIFTAGLWLEVPGSSKLCGVDEVIENLFQEMRKHNVKPSMISIRFIRFDNDPVGSRRLEALVQKFRSEEFPKDFW